MDAKEATEAVKTLKQMQIQLLLRRYYCEPFEHRALKLAIEALEKVPVLEAENARLGHLLALANQELEKRM